MKMSEAYDRTKKLERMIADYGIAINILKAEPKGLDRSRGEAFDLSCPITTLEAKRQELIDAVTELGNMNVVTPQTPEVVATQPEEDFGMAGLRPKQVWPPMKAPPFGKELVGKQCLFSNTGLTWHGPGECISYEENATHPYKETGHWKLAKLYYIGESA